MLDVPTMPVIDCAYHLYIPMKQILRSLVLVSLVFSLSGCVSRRSEQQAVVENVSSATLTETNSKIADDPDGHFHIRIPSGGVINKDLEEDGARLLHIEAGSGDNAAILFYIEESPNSVAVSVGLLSTLEGVEEVKREPVTMGGLEGMKLIVNLPQNNLSNVSYYFLRGTNDKTYIFSLAGGKPWAPFEQAVESFELITK